MTASRDNPTNARIEAILADPSSTYKEPMDVLRDDRLTSAEKRRVLEEWHLDASELQVAEEEGMAGGEPDRMKRVNEALARLSSSDG